MDIGSTNETKQAKLVQKHSVIEKMDFDKKPVQAEQNRFATIQRVKTKLKREPFNEFMGLVETTKEKENKLRCKSKVNLSGWQSVFSPKSFVREGDNGKAEETSHNYLLRSTRF